MVVPGWFFFFKHTISEHYFVCSTVCNIKKIEDLKSSRSAKKRRDRMFQGNDDNSGHQWVPITSQAITTVTTQQSWQRRSPNLKEALVTTNVPITTLNLHHHLTQECSNLFCISIHAKQMKRITFAVMNEITGGTFVVFCGAGDMFIYQVFNTSNHPSIMRCLITHPS